MQSSLPALVVVHRHRAKNVVETAFDGRFELLMLHDDVTRGLPAAKFVAFTPALSDCAKQSGWMVVSMKRNWKQIFKFDP